MITIETKTWLSAALALWLFAATPDAAAQAPRATSAGAHDEELVVDGRVRHYRGCVR